MAATMTPPQPARTRTGRLALVVADAGWYTTENLFREVPGDRARTLQLRCADYRVAWTKGWRPWNGPGPPLRRVCS